MNNKLVGVKDLNEVKKRINKLIDLIMDMKDNPSQILLDQSFENLKFTIMEVK